ncbi:MAG TPA: Ldh family oxidoreductase, partial [Devosia sp.]|nr:Ldh family oxidoreductase [Devosia sp.]
MARQPGVPEHGADRHPARDAAQDRPRQRDEALPAGQLTKPLRPERLIDFAAAVYQTAGLPLDDARLVADTLVQADLWGHQSHGVLRLPWYLARLKAGVCTAVA